MAVPKDITKEKIEDMKIEEVEVVKSAPSEGTDPSKSSFKVIESREDTRGKLAVYYVIGFFLILILASTFAFFSPVAEGRSTIDNIREAILTVSGILSGPLGFIIGFYFRKLDEE